MNSIIFYCILFCLLFFGFSFAPAWGLFGFGVLLPAFLFAYTVVEGISLSGVIGGIIMAFIIEQMLGVALGSLTVAYCFGIATLLLLSRLFAFQPLRLVARSDRWRFGLWLTLLASFLVLEAGWLGTLATGFVVEDVATWYLVFGWHAITSVLAVFFLSALFIFVFAVNLYRQEKQTDRRRYGFQ